MEFTFGVNVEVYEPNPDPEGAPITKKFTMSGRFPSPAFTDLQAVANAALEHLNRQLGTNFTAIRVLNEEDVEEIGVGEYKVKGEEDDKQAKRMAEETD